MDILVAIYQKTENGKPKTAFDPRHLFLPLFYHKERGWGKGQALGLLIGN